ncbi:MAG: RnfABCDGE type electron transport complex subunit D, partial [Treponema sp.]|nr:RnfABCDGE type electron transport complex subunit D [Treponema sp.]
MSDYSSGQWQGRDSRSARKIIFSHKPQISITCPSTGRMWLICFCAFLCVLQSAFSDGGRSLIVAAIAFISAVLIELLLTSRKSGISKIKDGSAAATAMILAIMLPNQIHP